MVWRLLGVRWWSGFGNDSSNNRSHSAQLTCRQNLPLRGRWCLSTNLVVLAVRRVSALVVNAHGVGITADLFGVTGTLLRTRAHLAFKPMAQKHSLPFSGAA
jgi:hypothetical protein